MESTPAGDSLYQAVSVPLGAENAPVVGALIVAVPLDGALAERLKRQTGSEVVFISFDTLGAPHVHAATVPAEQLEGALRERYAGSGAAVDSVPARLRVLAGGKTWIGAAGALRTASGLIVGEYAGLRRARGSPGAVRRAAGVVRVRVCGGGGGGAPHLAAAGGPDHPAAPPSRQPHA
ncbi:MAG: hypothetical protein IPK12_12150 [Gemmatimonadetes bacterium]|nr:hypothetical protein [Gemmatimonadota bacterium]